MCNGEKEKWQNYWWTCRKINWKKKEKEKIDSESDAGCREAWPAV